MAESECPHRRRDTRELMQWPGKRTGLAMPGPSTFVCCNSGYSPSVRWTGMDTRMQGCPTVALCSLSGPFWRSGSFLARFPIRYPNPCRPAGVRLRRHGLFRGGAEGFVSGAVHERCVSGRLRVCRVAERGGVAVSVLLPESRGTQKMQGACTYRMRCHTYHLHSNAAGHS